MCCNSHAQKTLMSFPYVLAISPVPILQKLVQWLKHLHPGIANVHGKQAHQCWYDLQGLPLHSSLVRPNVDGSAVDCFQGLRIIILDQEQPPGSPQQPDTQILASCVWYKSTSQKTRLIKVLRSVRKHCMEMIKRTWQT